MIRPRFEQPTLLDGVVVIQLGSCGVAIIDEADAELVLADRWTIARRWRSLYAMRQYRPGQTSYMHTLITGFGRTDHINGNGLDNRRVNLRPATHGQNVCNMVAHRDGTSRFKGVSWNKSRRLWIAVIQSKGCQHRLGWFADEVAAAKTYDEAARTLHGEFAALNFPRAGERSAVRGFA